MKIMNDMEELINMSKVKDFMHKYELKDEKKKTVLTVLGILAAITIVGVVVYCIVKYVKDRDDDFDDEFDDFDDDFDDDDFVKEDEAADQAEDTEE